MRRDFNSLMTSVLLTAAIDVSTDALAQAPQPAKPAPEHTFLKKFAGNWDCDNEAFFSPGQPPAKSKGTMKCRMLGNFWVLADIDTEVDEENKDDVEYRGLGTFGFDASKKKYMGTWVDSMSSTMWRYEGKVDGNKLILLTEGPNPFEQDKTVKARDTWQFKGEDVVVLTSEFVGDDGKYFTVMKATCKRVKSKD